MITEFSNLVEALRENCLSKPQNKAFTYVLDGELAEVHLTYGELDEKGRAIAVRLQQFTRPGDRAILLFPPGLEAIPALIGCLYAGLVVVPVIPPRPNQTADDLLMILSETTPRAILTNYVLEPAAHNLARNISGLTVVETGQVASKGK